MGKHNCGKCGAPTFRVALLTSMLDACRVCGQVTPARPYEQSAFKDTLEAYLELPDRNDSRKLPLAKAIADLATPLHALAKRRAA